MPHSPKRLVTIVVLLVALTCGRAAAAGCHPTVFAPAGTWHADRLRGGPGLVLSGGGLSGMPYETVLPWLRAHVDAPAGARAGNLLILKASDDERYYSDRFYKAALLQSVREINIPPCASRASVNAIAAYVDKSDFVLFAGGDQAHYAAWKGSALIDSVRRVYRRGGIVGGGSAGLAIQGQVVFDSVAADKVLPDDEDVSTPDAVHNPYERAISFTTDFFDWPPMRDTITDTHFARRDRFGRLTAFMARILRDRLVAQNVVYGVAVDEDAALLVNASGVATVVQRARESDGYVPKGAYIVRGAVDPRLVPGRPLRYTVSVMHLHRGQRFNLLRKQGDGTWYRVTVDGTRKPFYSRDPYSP